jgi:hypothetical protein
LTFAGRNYEGRQLDLSIIGLLGSGEDAVSMFDEQLADHIKCSVRTVQRYRAANIKESQATNFSFIEITEGEYDADRQRYQPTRYRFTGGDFINAVVAEARHSPDYKKNRREAIRKAAGEHYDEIPQAPPRQRGKKPRRSETMKIERDFENAAKNLAKGRRTLADQSERARNAFLAGKQGAELRELLLQMQQQIADVLEEFPQMADTEEVDEVPDNLSGIPPSSGEAAASVHVKKEEARTQPCHFTAQDLSDWDEVMARAHQPQVRRVSVPLRPNESPPLGERGGSP